MLVLSPEQEKVVRTHGENAYPNECCGVLIGEASDAGAKIARRAQAISNAREGSEQRNRFLITPEDMLCAEQAARAMKLDVVGFYHSHPDHPAAPSNYDKEHALPFYSYVIVSVKQGVAKELTSWELTTDRADFAQENISTEESQE